MSTPFAYISNSTQSWFLLSTLSKGFFDWNLKTSLDLQLSRNTGWQLTRVSDTDALTPQTETAGNGPPQKYRYDYLKMEPKLIWSPAEAFEAEYHATINYGGSKIGNDTHLAPLLDFVQRMHLTFSIGHVDLCLSGEHYRNDLNSDTHLNTLFVDASLIYKTRKLESGSQPQQSVQQERVCLYYLLGHTKLYFTVEYPSTGGYGDCRLSVLKTVIYNNIRIPA